MPISNHDISVKQKASDYSQFQHFFPLLLDKCDDAFCLWGESIRRKLGKNWASNSLKNNNNNTAVNVNPGSSVSTWSLSRGRLSLWGGGGGPCLSLWALLGSWPRGCCWGRPWITSSVWGGRTPRWPWWRGSPPLCWSCLSLSLKITSTQM